MAPGRGFGEWRQAAPDAHNDMLAAPIAPGFLPSGDEHPPAHGEGGRIVGKGAGEGPGHRADSTLATGWRHRAPASALGVTFGNDNHAARIFPAATRVGHERAAATDECDSFDSGLE